MARKRTPPHQSGFLVIDKPAKWTSHDVVGRVRRVMGERQVGHTGTLDPAATGVLPVAVGHATKLLPFIEDTDKTYIATVRFGVVTDSGDRDGRLLAQPAADHVTEAGVRAALDRFRGEIGQVPPMHSAIKVGGRKLYDVARSGGDIDVPVRRVYVHDIELLEWEHPAATIRVSCSAGTYIRTIARDLGEAVGSGAMLSRLTRTKAGMFGLRQALSIHDLEASLDCWGWPMVSLHPDAVLPDADLLILDEGEERRWFNGLPIERLAMTPVVRVYDSRREWTGIGLRDDDGVRIHPKRVVRARSE
ncbi:MAG TPA: tRNA pseudouridine(55) synthase TruB [Thermomicrobiales bacterium]|nr:tRNA pseudouridine(55) synthase TruB [Thermomicrobiales bacterium]